MRRVARTFFVLLALSVAAPIVRADESVKVPDVTGRSSERATALLEARGLLAHIIELAGPAVELVDSQDPEAGVSVQPGSSVVLRVGIRARIETRLPHVLGRPLDEALELLAGAYDVEVRVRDAVGSAPGSVVASEPEPGATLFYRAPLVLVVAAANADADARPRPAEPAGRCVPAAIGLTPEEACALLEAEGHKPRVTSRWAADAEPGRVVAQDPACGSPAEAGTEVALYVPEEGSVPSVVGLTHMDAVRELAAAGFASRFDARPAGRLDARVVEQRPPSDSRAVVGSPVVLRFDDDTPSGGRIWSAPPLRFVVVPDVRGRSPDDARRLIEQAGLSSTIDSRGRDAPGPVVTAMGFAPGARLREGATITLVAGPFALDAKPRPRPFSGAVAPAK